MLAIGIDPGTKTGIAVVEFPAWPLVTRATIHKGMHLHMAANRFSRDEHYLTGLTEVLAEYAGDIDLVVIEQPYDVKHSWTRYRGQRSKVPPNTYFRLGGAWGMAFAVATALSKEVVQYSVSGAKMNDLPGWMIGSSHERIVKGAQAFIALSKKADGVPTSDKWGDDELMAMGLLLRHASITSPEGAQSVNAIIGGMPGLKPLAVPKIVSMLDGTTKDGERVVEANTTGPRRGKRRKAAE